MSERNPTEKPLGLNAFAKLFKENSTVLKQYRAFHKVTWSRRLQRRTLGLEAKANLTKIMYILKSVEWKYTDGIQYFIR